MKYTGTLRYVDLGPGQWVLETNKGKVALFGDIGPELADRKVVVTGASVDAQTASMIGKDSVMVKSIEAA